MLYDKKWKTPEVKDKFGFDKFGYSGRPSTLIRTGISCLKQRLLVDEGFEPEWASGENCLAGSVFYFREDNACWTDSNCCALSSFAFGQTKGGFRELNLVLPKNIPGFIELAQMEDTDTFIEDMTKMANMFEREGF